MFKVKHTVLLSTALLLAAAFTVPASALEVTVDPTTQFCFSSDDFTASETDDGIFITSVPSANVATVYCGSRELKAGDALTTQALNALTLKTHCATPQIAEVEYCTISAGKISGVKSLKMSIRPKKNAPPIAENSDFETYKNIANSGQLKVKDPEDDPLTYKLLTPPKRGTVELHEDGSFTYTPNKNKVGNDSFEFSATDDAGNVSNTAKVSITISRPTNQQTYADIANDADQFRAMWLRENGIFTGTAVAGHLCFGPDAPVSRGEFLVMVMNLVDAANDLTAATSGFADEGTTPGWMQPYIAEALKNGMITGTGTEDGVVFRPTDTMSKAEAAVMLQNMLNLPEVSTPVFSSEEEESLVPVWAAEAFSALKQAGVTFDQTAENELLTRQAAGRLLYDIHNLIDNTKETFYWVK